MPDGRIDLGQQIHDRRVTLGYNRQDVERTAKIAAGQMSRVEAGERLPNVETLILLCAALACRFVITAQGIVLEALEQAT